MLGNAAGYVCQGRSNTFDTSLTCRYFYISILYNVCYTFALYGLMLFWIGASELLQPFNPLLKFILVKTVVFLTFWQVRQRQAHCHVSAPATHCTYWSSLVVRSCPSPAWLLCPVKV
jgi:hypothetical protein